MRKLLALLFLLAFPLLAQVPADDRTDTLRDSAPTEPARIYGVVLDGDEHPLADAEVRLWRDERPEAASTTHTDAKGGWTIRGLAAGTWRMMVIAPEHHAATGHVVLPPGDNRRVDVTLRPQSEVRILEAESLARMRPLPEAPVHVPEPGRLGSYRTSFAQRSPLSRLDVFLERHGLDRAEVEAADPQAANYSLSEESFEVVVPPSYDDSAPWGLMVWVSPTPWGGVRTVEDPSEDPRAILEGQHMLWVGANDSGNARMSWDRIGLALDAAEAMKELYSIDERRAYVGGYSGGGRLATALTLLYPEVFRGGFFAFGCNYYRDVGIPHQPGAVWPAAFPPPTRREMKHLREQTRLVFLTGENDFNRPQTRAYHRLYREDGFRHAVYLEIPGGDHYGGIPAAWLERGIAALDTPLFDP